MNEIAINIVYAHLRPDFISSMKRGNVLLTYTSRPMVDCDMYFYMDAFSYYGRQKGLDVLFLTEPTVVLPGQYNKDIWDRFDHVFTFYDTLVDRFGFAKSHIPRQGFHPWFGESEDFIITEDPEERKSKYPLHERRQAICMINGNKRSSVPGELYSKRIEAALWFYSHSDIPFDAYGLVPYFLPNYRGQVENNKKLHTLSRYKYSLCFENTGDPVFARGYVDKILDSLESRTLPIYLGCPNIQEYIPKDCFIDFRDFTGYRELDTYLENMSDKEYTRYIDAIDNWVTKGGLRTYSWQPLYDDLVKYCAQQKNIDCQTLFGSDSTWQTVPANQTCHFVDSSPLWTFQEHAAAPSPLIDYRENHGGITLEPDSEYIRRAVEFAKKGQYREAITAMAWLGYYQNADLLCFYAQILHMLGYGETEAVYLALALRLDPNHLPTRKQLGSISFDGRDFEKAISRFEATLTGKRMATEMVPGLTSIIITISDANDSARRCIESIRAHVEESYEVIIIKNETVKTPPWMEKLLTGDTCCTITGDPQTTGYAPACNQALEKAAGQYVLILDMNASMLKGTLTKMLECINRSPGCGIAIPASNCAIGIQQMPGVEGLSPREFEEYAPAFCRRNSNRRVIAYETDCACLLIKRSLIDAIGFFNEEIETPYFVVNDYRMRALIEGQQTVLAGDSCIYLNHEGPRQKGFDKIFHELWDTFDPNSETGRKLSPHVAMKNARDHYGKGLLNEAVQAIMEGIKYTPENGDLYYCLAEILLDAKLYDQAMEALESLPENEKGSLHALEMLGYCSFYLGRAEEAGNYAARALALSGDSVRALDLKGLLALASEDREKAEAFFRQAITTDPCFADGYINLGVLKWHGNGGAEALDLIEKGFILSPDTTDFSATYHSAVTALSEFSRAEIVLLEAFRLFPLNKTLGFLTIGTLLQQEKYAEAMEETEKSMITFGIDDGILAAALQIREKVGPRKLDENYRKGSLSICMIVKNEEEQIAKCLMSLKPVADEIIVVDTGSTDKTREISQALGAHVYDFPWTNDFSEARNFSMSKARGQWILVHDADEVVSARDYDKLRRILNQNPTRPVAYSLITRNYSTDSVYEGWTANSGEYPYEEAGTGWFPSPKVRLLTNDGRFRFENPIHELLEPSLRRANVDIKSCDIVIHHYGQADPDRGQAKAEMYYLIGKRKLETDGNQEAALRELAVQARAIGKYDESIELWNRYLMVKPDHYLPYFNMSGCYFEKEDFDKAFQAAKKSFELNSDSKEAAQCYAVTSLFCGNGSEAVKSLENLLQTLPLYPTGKMTLAAAHCITGMEEKGIQELTELKEMAYDCSEVLYNLSKKFIAAGKPGCAIALLESMERSGHVHPHAAGLLQESYDMQAISVS